MLISLFIPHFKMIIVISGATCISIIVSQNKVIYANFVDSRAILFRYENGVYYSINLIRHHKPTETDEMKRILSNGRRIKHFYDNKSNIVIDNGSSSIKCGFNREETPKSIFSNVISPSSWK